MTQENYKFTVKISEEIEGIVKTTKTRDETLSILEGDLLEGFGEGNFEVSSFELITPEDVTIFETMLAEPSTPSVN